MPIAYLGSFITGSIDTTTAASFTFPINSTLSSGSMSLIAVAVDNTTCVPIGGQNSYTSSLISCIRVNNLLEGNSFSYALQGTGSAFNGTVRTILPDGSGNYYVGGDFTTYTGPEGLINTPYLVRLSSAGAVNQQFAVDGPVYKLALQTGITGSVANGAWAAGGAMITARSSLGGAGTQNAGLAFGGFTTVGVACTEAYNGASWSAGGAMIAARQNLAGAGTNTAALGFGGFISPANVACTEAYNGTSWSAGGAMITARRVLGGAGTQNAALGFSGLTPALVSCTEAYNGTSWSAGGAMIAARQQLAGAGTQNAALAIGGFIFPATVACTEAYNGTSWSAGGAINTARSDLAGTGIQNAALTFGGGTPTIVTCTEAYNGTSWSTRVAMITARAALAGAGTQAAALAFGGATPTNVACTEAFFGASGSLTNDLSTKLIAVGQFTNYGGFSSSGSVRINTTDASRDASFNVGSGSNNTVCTIGEQAADTYTGVVNTSAVWAAGGGLIASVLMGGRAGTITAALAAGGGGAYTQAYNGTTWSLRANLINCRGRNAGAGFQNAALTFGGYRSTPIFTLLACTETYNGTAWSAGGAMITARQELAGAGTNTAALAFGGAQTAPIGNATETYNGTTWATGGNMNAARYGLGGAGESNVSVLAFGGNRTYGNGSTCTEAYNGTTWSVGGALNATRQLLAGAGAQCAALAFGGNNNYGGPNPRIACTENYNGFTWSTRNPLITARQCVNGAGAAGTGLAFGGNVNPGGASTFNTEAMTYATTFNSKLFFGGTFTNYSGSASSGSVRVNNNGTRDTTFNVGVGFSPSDVRILIPSGSVIFFGGAFTSYSGSSANRLVAVNSSNGTISSSFNIGTGFNGAVNSIAVQFNSGILTTGEFTSYSGSSINRLARLNVDGTLDTAFSASIGTGLNDTGSVVCIYPNAVQAWSTRTAMITATGCLAGTGIQNAALAFGGFASPATVACTEAYNGTSWSGGGALSTARYGLAGAGLQNVALAFGGSPSVPGPGLACTEAYNGTSWSVRDRMINARFNLAGAGTQNSALAFGNRGSGILTEAYNGISWSSGGNLITARERLAGAGASNTAALAFGGLLVAAPFANVACTETYNGTTWSAVAAMITGRSRLAGTSIQNAALAFGGLTPTAASCTEAYDGTTWVIKSGMITARGALAGAGTQTSALAFGAPTCTEAFSEAQILVGGAFTAFSGSTYSGSVRLNVTGTLDTTWNIGTGFSGSTSVLDYATASVAQQAGSQVISVGAFTCYGGLTPNCITIPTVNPQSAQNRIIQLNSNGTMAGTYLGTQWDKVSEVVETSGSNAGVAIALFQRAITSSLVPGTNTVTVFLSSSVTNKVAAGWAFSCITSTLTSSLSITGSSNPNISPQSMSFATASNPANNLLFRVIGQEGLCTNTFTPSFCFNSLTPSGVVGTFIGAWSTGGAMITARAFLAGAGTNTSALAFGGTVAPVNVACTETYNGTSWLAGGAMITGRCFLAGAGATNTAALAFGGFSGLTVSCTEAYNGTSWSAGSAMITGTFSGGRAGTQNAALAFGGYPVVGCTQAYNGTSWSIGTAMICSRRRLAGGGVQNNALGFGGENVASAALSCTEAYNGTSWSAGGVMITARSGLAGAGATNTAALAFGGNATPSPALFSCTEQYIGSTWTAVTAMSTARAFLAGTGTNTAALAFGGSTPANAACTEAFNISPSINLSLTGEFANTNYNATQVSSPIYVSGSNASIFYGFWEPAGPFNNSTTYVILSD